MMLSCALKLIATHMMNTKSPSSEYTCCMVIKSGGYLLLYFTVRRYTSTLGWYKVGAAAAAETFTEILATQFGVCVCLSERGKLKNRMIIEIPEYCTPEKAAFVVAKKP